MLTTLRNNSAICGVTSSPPLYISAPVIQYRIPLIPLLPIPFACFDKIQVIYAPIPTHKSSQTPPYLPSGTLTR